VAYLEGTWTPPHGAVRGHVLGVVAANFFPGSSSGKMDRRLFGHEWLAAQIQTMNPILVLLMLPLFLVCGLSPVGTHRAVAPRLRKIGSRTSRAFAFIIIALIQERIDAGGNRTHLQIWAICRIERWRGHGVADHLEFAYTQARDETEISGDVTYLWRYHWGTIHPGRRSFIQNPDAQ